MYKNSLKLLNTHNVKLEKGLTYSEITQIEKIYNIKFPNSLRKFLTTILPTSKGFYNWRNVEKSNVNFIKQVMDEPISYINNVPDEVYWCDNWGEEPKDKETLIKEVKMHLNNAPKLIPIYVHRYMPITFDEDPPIISVHGLDIIYYGKNLEDYFEIEFGNKKQDSISFSDVKHIEFWSDIL